MRILLARLRGWRRERRVSRDIDRELQFHLDLEIEANVARGMSPDDARRAALRDLGGVTQTREAVLEVRILGVESVWQDVRLALRNLRMRPGVGLAAGAMLALGIGITTAMFTIVDALLLRPVPFDRPDELTHLFMGNERGGSLVASPAVLRAWRQSPGLAGAEGAITATALVDSDGQVVTRGMARITPGLFAMLGQVQPVRGRLFTAADGQPGADDRIVISEDVWRSLYGADERVIGRRVRIDSDWLTVVGVVPSEFRFPAWDTVIWRAVDFSAPAIVRAEILPLTYVRIARATPRADALRLATEAAHAADPRTARLRAREYPVAGMVLDDYYQRAVPMLAGGVVLVFAVLCANVCSLLIASFTARRKEFGVRAALGAGRSRLLRQAFVENCLLGILGILGGAGVAWVLVTLARGFLPEAFLIRTLNPLNVDLRALGITSLSGVVATFAAGLLPAWLATRVDAADTVHASDRGGTDTRAARRTTRALLVVEIALSCTLLAGATLLVRSFVNLTAADRGLDAAGKMTATMLVPPTEFPDQASRAAMAVSLEDGIRQLPGVEAVAWSYGIPPRGGALSFGDWQSDVPGRPAVNLEVAHYQVSRNFFATAGITLLRGRMFTSSDTTETVIVGEQLARALWPGLDPVGRAFTHDNVQYRVVGVAKELRYPALDPRIDRPEFYQPLDVIGPYRMMIIRCSSRCPDAALIRQRLAATHPAIRPVDVQTLEDEYREQLARPRAAAALSFAFAAIASLAAAGGLFSVLTYAVSRRRREFGIRTALGASPNHVRRVILGDGLLVAATGILLGTAAAAALARALSSLQYGVTVTDPVSVAIVLGVLGLTTLAASWYPARQASRVDPVLLLREE